MTTDTIIIGAALYLFFKGWHRGFLRTLLGPVSLLIGCAMGFMYYHRTQNLVLSFGISIISPFIITILVSAMLKLWHKAVNDKASLPFSSRLLGSIISILWGGSYLAITLISIGIIPIRSGWFEKIQNDVTTSKSYTLLVKWTGNKIPATSIDMKKISDIYKDPSAMEKFQSTKEFKSLIEDERLKEIFSDETTAEQIRNKDFSKLLSNPKIQAVFQDKELLEKVFALNKIIMEEEPGKKTTKSQPRVIDIE